MRVNRVIWWRDGIINCWLVDIFEKKVLVNLILVKGVFLVDVIIDVEVGIWVWVFSLIEEIEEILLLMVIDGN